MILEEMTTVEVEAALKTCRSVFIPFGVMEAHGPHLPLSTDTIQAYDAGKRAAQLVPLLVAPPIPYGYCRSLGGHDGTISISAAVRTGPARSRRPATTPSTARISTGADTSRIRTLVFSTVATQE